VNQKQRQKDRKMCCALITAKFHQPFLYWEMLLKNKIQTSKRGDFLGFQSPMQRKKNIKITRFIFLVSNL
jgi:hypothetical protein